MKEYDLHKLLEDASILQNKINELLEKRVIKQQCLFQR